MNEPIEIFSSKLKSVEKVDLLNAIDNLNAHMKNKTYFKPSTFSINKNTNIKEDFSSKTNGNPIFMIVYLKSAIFLRQVLQVLFLVL